MGLCTLWESTQTIDVGWVSEPRASARYCVMISGPIIRVGSQVETQGT